MLKEFIIKKLGGFPTLDDAINHIKNINDENRKRAILSEAVKKLYNAICAEDILKQMPDGKWLFQGKPLTDGEIVSLKEQATELRGMRLWQVIKMDIRYQLGKKMFEEAKVQDDILWGQLILYLDDIIRTRLNRM